jgi:hypothetical protein
MSSLAKRPLHCHSALCAAPIVRRGAAKGNTMNMAVGEMPIRASRRNGDREAK